MDESSASSSTSTSRRRTRRGQLRSSAIYSAHPHYGRLERNFSASSSSFSSTSNPPRRCHRLLMMILLGSPFGRSFAALQCDSKMEYVRRMLPRQICTTRTNNDIATAVEKSPPFSSHLLSSHSISPTFAQYHSVSSPEKWFCGCHAMTRRLHHWF